MSRKFSILLNLGVSMALIAGAIWFLFNHQSSFGVGDGTWLMPHHTVGGSAEMGLFMILFWVAVIAAIAMIVSSVASRRPRAGEPGQRRQQPDAMEVLDRRYAQGDIDQATYRTMKSELQQH